MASVQPAAGAAGGPGGCGPVRPYPKIELHVHLEATVRPERLLSLARRHDVRLPARDPDGLRAFIAAAGTFRDFVRVWVATTAVLRERRDFREVVVDYAADLARQGCVYAEALFSPAEPVLRGTPWREVFEGYCEGADLARERHGVEVRFTPDITRDLPVELADRVVAWAARYRERGVVGVSLGGSEDRYPAGMFAAAFARARAEGLRAAPHAGELAGPESVRAALEVLGAERLRHGIRAVEDPGLLREIAARGVVCDVTPVSNVRLGVVPSLAAHPLPAMLAAGVRCSVSSDDPVLMATDLSENCAVAERLGHTPQRMYFDALAGAFCDEATRERLRRLGEAYDWGQSGAAGASTEGGGDGG